MKVFVTGGAGYIGTHTIVELSKAGHEICVFDDFSNSDPSSLENTGLIINKSLSSFEGDIRNFNSLANALERFQPDAVIHFAGLKAVSESVTNPLKYYDVNVRGTIELLKAMELINCDTIIFSSSAAVYGDESPLPYRETGKTGPSNPYGRTKLVVENMLMDWSSSSLKRKAVCLRYFNPVGAHKSSLIGESPLGLPNNLMPSILQTVHSPKQTLKIFGDDYDTRDGTCERDFIHVVDLANGHLLALERISSLNSFNIINLGRGSGVTVKELISTFEVVTGNQIRIEYSERRQGDVAKSFADTSLAAEVLGFRCEKTVENMCEDSWRWYRTATMVNSPNS